MKLENTYKNKIRFFNLYWGQEVLSDKRSYKPTPEKINIDANRDEVSMFLNLKSISDITDEELVEVMHLNNFKVSDEFSITRDFDMWGDPTVELKVTDGGEAFISNNNFYLVDYNSDEKEPNGNSYDFLRLKGYAMSYYNLSVDDLIKYNWIKLKKNNDYFFRVLPFILTQTTDKSDIICDVRTRASLYHKISDIPLPEKYEYQHLHIIGVEPPKIGQWVKREYMNNEGDNESQIFIMDEKTMRNPLCYYPIVASTNNLTQSDGTKLPNIKSNSLKLICLLKNKGEALIQYNMINNTINIDKDNNVRFFIKK